MPAILRTGGIEAGPTSPKRRARSHGTDPLQLQGPEALSGRHRHQAWMTARGATEVIVDSMVPPPQERGSPFFFNAALVEA